MKILIADDDSEVRELLKECLEILGYEVTEVENGQQLLDRLAEGGEFDLVISDNQMPTVSGVAALRQIRGTGNGMPVIVFSSDEGIAVRRAAENLGGFFLAKTFRPAEIEAAINEATRHPEQ